MHDLCTWLKETTNSYEDFTENIQGKRPFERPRHCIKLNPKEKALKSWIALSCYKFRFHQRELERGDETYRFKIARKYLSCWIRKVV